jgi:lysophospholipase L1-like esterase
MKIAFFGDSLTQGIPGSSYLAILRKELPHHQLFNLGKGNDTVVSLYRRVSRMRFDDAPFDVAFLWVGVNDIDRGGSWAFQIANALRRQPRSRNLDDFKVTYQSTLNILGRNADRIVAVSPLLKGENVHNRWNRELESYAQAIHSLADQHERTEYLDLRKRFCPELAKVRVTDYLPKSPFHVGLDILMVHGDAQVDKRAAERGLHLTLDGIHLNSTGAKLVAEAFLEVIGEHGG